MPAGDVALGDGEEARQPCLGREQVVAARIQRAVGGAIADGEQPALRVEQEAEIHRVGHRTCGRCQCGQPPGKGPRCVGMLCDVAAPALDGALGRVRPEEQVGAGLFAVVAMRASGRCPPAWRRDRIRRCKLVLRVRLPESSRRRSRASSAVEPLVEARPVDTLRGRARRQHATCLARAAPARPGRRPRHSASHGNGGPLAGGIGDGDQVCGEVAAVHRRHVARVQRPKVPRVVPVVEVAAEALQPVHGTAKRRFQPLHRLDRADPAEIAGAGGGQEVEADVRGRGAVGQDRVRVLLEVVGRQHVVVGRDERLEVAPGAARDEAQCARVRVADRKLPVEARRAADPERDGRGGDPQQRERRCEPRGSAAGAIARRSAAITVAPTPPAILR